jgi:hypothetical protein
MGLPLGKADCFLQPPNIGSAHECSMVDPGGLVILCGPAPKHQLKSAGGRCLVRRACSFLLRQFLRKALNTISTLRRLNRTHTSPRTKPNCTPDKTRWANVYALATRSSKDSRPRGPQTENKISPASRDKTTQTTQKQKLSHKQKECAAIPTACKKTFSRPKPNPAALKPPVHGSRPSA